LLPVRDFTTHALCILEVLHLSRAWVQGRKGLRAPILLLPEQTGHWFFRDVAGVTRRRRLVAAPEDWTRGSAAYLGGGLPWAWRICLLRPLGAFVLRGEGGKGGRSDGRRGLFCSAVPLNGSTLVLPHLLLIVSALSIVYWNSERSMLCHCIPSSLYSLCCSFYAAAAVAGLRTTVWHAGMPSCSLRHCLFSFCLLPDSSRHGYMPVSIH
jgi:hypothetical protein